MNDLGKRRPWFVCRNDHQISRKASLSEEPGSCGLPSTRHEQETVPVVALGVASDPLCFAPGVTRDVHEAYD